MLLRVTASMMALVMVVTSAAPAQLIPTRRTRDPFRQAPSSTPSVAPADSAAAALAMMPKGLDAPINPDQYVIGPGDQFVMFMKSAGTEVPLRVLPEGTVLVPNAGLVRAAGLTITAFRAELSKVLGSFYRGGEVYVELVIPRTFVVYVLGSIRNPGPVELSAPFRLDSVIRAVSGALGTG